MARKEKHTIQMPGSILDQIRSKEESGAYADDNSRFTGPSRKRKSEGSRKEARKAEREAKKQKRTKSQPARPQKKLQNKPKVQIKPAEPKLKGILKTSGAPKTNKKVKLQEPEKHESHSESSYTQDEFSHSDSEGEDFEEGLDEEDFDEDVSDLEDLSEEATWEALAKLKPAKSKKAEASEKPDENIELLENDSESIDDEEDWSEFESDNDPETAEDTYAALAALKAKKAKPEKESKIKDEEKLDKKEKKDKKNKKDKKDKKDTIVYDDPSILEGADDDLDYYARKLGTKASSKLEKTGDDDIIGGLLDGIDLDFGSGTEHEESEEEDLENPFSSDDEINESDFDDEDEFDEEDRALLREMEEVEGSSSEDEGPRVKENPYVAPVSKTETTSKYVPPALRRLQQSSEHSEQLQKITRSIRGPLNRMSETTIPHTVSELNNAYNDNPRQLTTEAFTNLILDTIVVPNRLLDSFVLLYSTITVALFKLQGPDFGAYLLQTSIEKLEQFFNGKTQMEGKESLNLIAFLSYCYSLGLFGSKLMYDIIDKRLVSDINEVNIELLLKIVKTCGTKMRTDDPSSLKEIIVALTKKVSETEKESGKKATPRARFLIDTVTNLKNNKIRDDDDGFTSSLFVRLKKAIGSIKGSASVEVMQVSLQDILDVEKRGKWWLVGAAWKGKDMEKSDEPSVNTNVMEDYLDTAEPNWLELAKQQRMNTDIRRAIFVSIMSANDFMDSFDKLEKLQLKKQQEREIVNITLHCVSMESVYNPYYGYLAKKLCEKHSLKKTFQFSLWDFMKDLEGEDEGEDDLRLETGALENESLPLHKILNTGRLYGFLIAQGCLPLNILRNVNFLTATTNTKLFIEILLISFFDNIANTSKKHASKMHEKEAHFDEREIVQILGQCREQPVLLKGLQFFIQDTVLKSDLIGGKKQKKRVTWAAQTMSDMIEVMVE